MIKEAAFLAIVAGIGWVISGALGWVIGVLTDVAIADAMALALTGAILGMGVGLIIRVSVGVEATTAGSWWGLVGLIIGEWVAAISYSIGGLDEGRDVMLKCVSCWSECWGDY